mgnify:CR=1 FL=1
MIQKQFEDSKGYVNADSQGRLTLGVLAKNKTYTLSYNEVGQILLTPVAVIPEHEAWLYKNPEAYQAVLTGLAQAKEGDLHYMGSFAQYADLDVEEEGEEGISLPDADWTAFVSEEAIGRIWNHPEEDEAWGDL